MSEHSFFQNNLAHSVFFHPGLRLAGAAMAAGDTAGKAAPPAKAIPGSVTVSFCDIALNFNETILQKMFHYRVKMEVVFR